MKKKSICKISAVIFAILFITSCMDRDIFINDLTGESTNITVTCSPASLALKVGESADVAVEVTGAGKGIPVSCFSSDADIVEAYEVDNRTIMVKGISAGQATVSVSCGDSAVSKVEVTVSDE